MIDSEGVMPSRPFYRLKEARVVDRPDLPTDLVEFYSYHEGGVWELDPDHAIRLYKLDEVERHRWCDVHLYGSNAWPGSEEFDGILIGSDHSFDYIYYILSCSWCDPGSIYTIGVNVAGPGGRGSIDELLEPTLVLAPSFSEWLKQLERVNWIDCGLYPGEINHLPPDEQVEHRRYYKKLNPHIEWGTD